MAHLYFLQVQSHSSMLHSFASVTRNKSVTPPDFGCFSTCFYLALWYRDNTHTHIELPFEGGEKAVPRHSKRSSLNTLKRVWQLSASMSPLHGGGRAVHKHSNDMQLTELTCTVNTAELLCFHSADLSKCTIANEPRLDQHHLSSRGSVSMGPGFSFDSHLSTVIFHVLKSIRARQQCQSETSSRA